MNFTGANCQGANFTDAECQGADFWFAKCQGASFNRANCRGAYSLTVKLSSTLSQRLSGRLKKPTKLNIIIAGAFSEEEIADIEGFKNNPHLQSSNNSWYEKMQQIIANNEGKQQQRGVPKGIISGVLGEDEAEKAEIQKIIAQLAEIEKRG